MGWSVYFPETQFSHLHNGTMAVVGEGTQLDWKSSKVLGSKNRWAELGPRCPCSTFSWKTSCSSVGLATQYRPVPGPSLLARLASLSAPGESRPYGHAGVPCPHRPAFCCSSAQWGPGHAALNGGLAGLVTRWVRDPQNGDRLRNQVKP